MWDVHLDTGRGQFENKGAKKNPDKQTNKTTTDPIQTVIGGENSGVEKIHPALYLVNKIYLNYISWIKL